jgi:hypothetical protein
VYFGLGRAPAADKVAIHWPDGAVTRLADVAADRVLEISR